MTVARTALTAVLMMATASIGFQTVRPVQVFKQPDRVTDRKGNTEGTVIVPMYHHVGPSEKYMFRSYAHFRNDLLRFYKMGFRPVTMREFVNDKMNLAPGASPVVFTFDDSHRDQFNIRDDGTIDPNCFVGIWLAFAEKHPDFPLKATFYVNANGPFGQKKWVSKKIEMLKSWGCQVGSHTMSHPNLKTLSDDKVKKEMGECISMIEALGLNADSFCYPYGIKPKNMSIVTQGFEYNGKHYKHTDACLAGDRPALSPKDKKFNLYNIARVGADEGDHGLTYWLNRIADGRHKPYVQP